MKCQCCQKVDGPSPVILGHLCGTCETKGILWAAKQATSSEAAKQAASSELVYVGPASCGGHTVCLVRNGKPICFDMKSAESAKCMVDEINAMLNTVKGKLSRNDS
jgi:hypothetical protein